jgi:murein DD-endopeptidase MepM/ murein hydrolase activator NlpD
MTRHTDRDAPLPFTVAMSFLMGMVTTIAVYSLRTESSGQPVADVRASEPATPPEPLQANRPTVQEPATPVSPAPVSSTEAGVVVALQARDLKVPVAGVDRKDLRNTFSEARGSRTHEALDIIAPRGREVLAVEDGRVQKLFASKAGGLTIYQFDPTETFAYYYAHLDRYANELEEGKMVRRGDVIGYVGSTGNASPDAPHLHFAIFRLGPEREWWKGDAINPYLVFSELR